MTAVYPPPAGNALTIAGSLGAAWLGTGAALLAHRGAGAAALVLAAAERSALGKSLGALGIELVGVDPAWLEDSARARGQAIEWLGERIRTDTIDRLHLCADAPQPLRAAALEAARRAGLALWISSGTTPLSVTHGLADPALLARKAELAASLAAPDQERALALQRFYGVALAAERAEAYRCLDLGALHSRTPDTLLAPPGAGGEAEGWPLVSVIVRSTDRRSLPEVLDSIACQTYPRVEVLIVNASGIPHPSLRTPRKDLPVRLLDGEGHSLARAAAANAGLSAAAGQYALFLDDDDLLYPSHIEALYRTLQRTPIVVAAFAGVRVEHFDAAGELVELGELNDPFDRRRLLIQNYLPIHAVLFDLPRVRAAGCAFDETLEVYEDWDFWLQLSKLSEFAHTGVVSAVYRNFGGSGLGLETRAAAAAISRARLRSKWQTATSPEQWSAAVDYATDDSNPWISNWRRLCAAREIELNQSERERRAAEEKIQALFAQVGAALEKAEHLEGTIRRQQDELAVARSQNIALDNHLRFLRESTSWRITRPLRLLSVTARQAGRLTKGTVRLAREHGGWSHLLSRGARSARRYGLRVTLGRALTHLGLARSFAQADGMPLLAGRPGQVDVAPPAAVAPLISAHAPVDVVVCVHNALEDVRRCLDSVFAHTTDPFRLILVDDGSDAPTATYLKEIAGDPRCLLLRNESAVGYTLAANMGMRASTGAYVVLLNSDTIVADEWLTRLLRCAESDAAIGMVGPLSNTASWQSIPKVEDQGDWARNPLPPGWGVPQMGEAIAGCGAPVFPRLPFLNGFCLLIKRAVLDAIGLFDEETFARGYGEENDYCLRLYESGWSLAVADDVYVYHAQSRSYSDERRKRLQELAAEALARKHGQPLIDSLALKCRYSRVMAGIRARSAVCPERASLRREGRSRFAGKRVLFLLPTADAGGGANVIVSEAERMLDMGVDAAIANLTANRPSFEGAYDGLRLPVHWFRRPEDIGEVARDFDAVVASIYYTVGWLRPLAGSRAVLGYYVQDFEPRWFAPGTREHREAIESYTLLPELRLFCKTDWNRREVETHTGARCRVLGPSVEVDLFRPRRERSGERVVIAAMVRPYSSYRAPEATMRILSRIKAAYPDECEILTFGVDPADPSFQRLKPEVPIAHLGKLSSPQLATVFDQIDVFADFSTYQAMGLTAMEAMACGAAVIVPAAGGATEFARHEFNALVVDTSKELQCYSALERLLEDEALRRELGENALVDVQQFFPERAAYELLSALFDPRE